MKFCVVSFYDKRSVEKEIKKRFRLDKRKPDFVFTYGGDGTILFSEQLYPGVPKIPIRKSWICSKCVHYSANYIGKILDRLEKKQYKIKEQEKIEAIFNGRKLVALNDIQVHNANPAKALRFTLIMGSKKYNFIGDGVVASTPYGSTAYYNALGYKPFSKGIRIGLNNTHPRRGFFVLDTKTTAVKVTRETALLIADNNEKMTEMKLGDKVLMRKSKSRARFVEIK